MRRQFKIFTALVMLALSACQPSSPKKIPGIIDAQTMRNETYALFQAYIKGIDACADWPCHVEVVKKYGSKKLIKQLTAIKKPEEQKERLASSKAFAKFWLHDVDVVHPEWLRGELVLRYEKDGKLNTTYSPIPIVREEESNELKLNFDFLYEIKD